MMANVTILVHPGTPVDIDVQAVLASIEDQARLLGRPARQAPPVRVVGRAMFSNIEVHAAVVGPGRDED